MFGGTFLDEHVERGSFAKLRIGDDHLARVDVSGVHAVLGEGSSDDPAGKPFTIADHEIGAAGSQFEDGGESAQNLVERVKFLFNEIAECGGVGWCLDQCAGG